MKLLLVIVSILMSTLSFEILAGDNSICDSLYTQAEKNCQESICTDWLTNEGQDVNEDSIQQCIVEGGGDLAEEVQLCVVDGGEMELLVDEYNKNKTPSEKVTCEDF